MIIFTKENLFDTDADLLVNTVNCVGVMGKGIALEFKERYPLNFKTYKSMCNKNELHIGMILMVKETNKTIVNFPTKIDWKNDSKYEYIYKGLKSLRGILKQRSLIFPNESIAIPMLGCSNGNLNWDNVKHLIVNALSDINMKIYICEN